MKFEIAKGRLKSALIMAGMTRSELSYAANIPSHMIGRYVGGTMKPGVEHLAQIADTLNVTPDYLMGEGPALDSQKVFKSVNGRIREHASSWSGKQRSEVAEKINAAIYGDCVSIAETNERFSVNRIIFSERLHIAMINANLSSVKVGKIAGMSDSTVSLYVLRKSYPTNCHVIQLAEALGTTADFLQGRDLNLESLTAYYQVMRQIQSFAGFWTEE